MSDAIDKAALMENIDEDLEFLAEMVDIYDDDGPQLISQMRDAIAGGDCGGLTMAAHTYKGMVGNFRAEPAQQAALGLEMMGKGGDLAGAEEALGALEAQAERLRAALADLLGGGRA